LMLGPLDTQSLLTWKESVDPDLRTVIDIVMASGNRSVYAFYETFGPSLLFMYRTVPAEYVNVAAMLSTMGVALDIAIDDVADQVIDTDESRAVINHAAAVIRGARVPAKVRTKWGHRKAETFADAWSIYASRMAQAPCFQAYRRLWRDEWIKMMGSMWYSLEVNTNPAYPYEFEMALEKLAPNMHLVIKHVVDLCFSPEWDASDTGFALDFARRAERIMRISNWIRSWRAELRQGVTKADEGVGRDITSGVCALALEQGLLTRQELHEADVEELIQRFEANRVEQSLRNIGLEMFDTLMVEVDRYVEANERDAVSGFMNIDVYRRALYQMIADPHVGGNQPR
jgi:hypothetical protein